MGAAIPSRDFMVRQAVLNAMHMPPGMSTPHFLFGLTGGGRLITEPFRRDIVAEYRALASRYQVAA